MEEEWSRLQQALTTCFSQGVTFKDGIENQFLLELIFVYRGYWIPPIIT